ncbi:response regulator [Pseudemcibacter aquimaris]|uniref:response regulator n=1 Tax=Pseudemcibacter aquimaris TaxID=2857064 RepID=UPI002012B480|nr:response regulator transcription factor [Pseudemcibacter aquimaris]MCC3860147.1 response regulator transcription factor [Pseudemcibacter aquimaris]WDU57474.1 response regulator transcription factor [Pseudemcibacter aquimaris]
MSDVILIVDDEDEFRDVVSALLELNGFEVLETQNVNEMYSHLENRNISLILLDISLPDQDGLSALKELREGNDIPIVLLTGKGDINYKVVGLELGADDYITKPFHSHELVARLKNILRRSSSNNDNGSGAAQNDDMIVFNGWKLDTHSRTLFAPDGENIAITGHEYAILSALISAAGRTLSREQLLDHIGANSRDYTPFDRSLDVMVAKLRRKLKDDAKNPQYIRTIRQVGYMFIGKIE